MSPGPEWRKIRQVNGAGDVDVVVLYQNKEDKTSFGYTVPVGVNDGTDEFYEGGDTERRAPRAGMISAALRLMSIGQKEGQLVLSRQMENLAHGVDNFIASPARPLMSFTPLVDIAQMNHRTLYSRLFRS